MREKYRKQDGLCSTGDYNLFRAATSWENCYAVTAFYECEAKECPRYLSSARFLAFHLNISSLTICRTQM